jgi:hypothetical protein
MGQHPHEESTQQGNSGVCAMPVAPPSTPASAKAKAAMTNRGFIFNKHTLKIAWSNKTPLQILRINEAFFIL